LRNGLAKPRLERAIGVIYRPDTDLASHYFQAVLPQQFDEYIWIDETSAVEPIQASELQGIPVTCPFGLWQPVDPPSLQPTGFVLCDNPTCIIMTLHK